MQARCLDYLSLDSRSSFHVEVEGKNVICQVRQPSAEMAHVETD
ncbi:hypothetical protein VD0002_g993 [Verticillium dahliae]|uniref:Uncharacterized protein n=1 Tax=Verticillium dahliae TaxID=27337 RepID=A0AA44WPK3_VERDA|nr:hypothetical protein BJF96_g2015 [Verticillium dahliae]PNH37854.1 hypothetical protein VD0004_g8946 [Verticillium dahliae]PNH55675.1 hypothetical protein VD0003_g1995 [Verticillium dahliae]PNH69364.1 hypothetical protein VD0002_g993 [Verticillium dahliae]PNH75422.1 hypothetical protein VD0001_g2121 [Verticillium dahliae]